MGAEQDWKRARVDMYATAVAYLENLPPASEVMVRARSVYSVRCIKGQRAAGKTRQFKTIERASEWVYFEGKDSTSGLVSASFKTKPATKRSGSVVGSDQRAVGGGGSESQETSKDKTTQQGSASSSRSRSGSNIVGSDLGDQVMGDSKSQNKRKPSGSPAVTSTKKPRNASQPVVGSNKSHEKKNTPATGSNGPRGGIQHAEGSSESGSSTSTGEDQIMEEGHGQHQGGGDDGRSKCFFSCDGEDATVVAPCGHLICCNSCLPNVNIKRCPFRCVGDIQGRLTRVGEEAMRRALETRTCKKPTCHHHMETVRYFPCCGVFSQFCRDCLDSGDKRCRECMRGRDELDPNERYIDVYL